MQQVLKKCLVVTWVKKKVILLAVMTKTIKQNGFISSASALRKLWNVEKLENKVTTVHEFMFDSLPFSSYSKAFIANKHLF